MTQAFWDKANLRKVALGFLYADIRSNQRWDRIAAIKKANRGEPPKINCKRCGKPCVAEWLNGLARWLNHCEACMCRNFIDGLGLPTPPDMLDRYTLNPTLTEEDFQRNLRK